MAEEKGIRNHFVPIFRMEFVAYFPLWEREILGGRKEGKSISDTNQIPRVRRRGSW
jgi:hypothetical protein